MSFEKKKSILIFICAAALITAVVMFCGFAFEKEDEEATAISGVTADETENVVGTSYDYRYLRGTKYKNLYAAGYSNLFGVTMVKDEADEASSDGYYQTAIGSAANPGYYGTVGSYSLSDKTIAAHLTVQGTSIQDKAIWQCSTSTTYYESSSVAWAAKTANLRSGELSQNTVIYGHNWNNCFVPFKKTGSQFESLMAFTYEDFVSENQYIYLTTNSGVHTFKIFAVAFTKDLSFYINCNNIDVASIAAKAKSMSLFDFGVSVSSSDKIITLSTCTRYYSGLGANQRFIIMGKLVD